MPFSSASFASCVCVVALDTARAGRLAFSGLMTTAAVDPSWSPTGQRSRRTKCAQLYCSRLRSCRRRESDASVQTRGRLPLVLPERARRRASLHRAGAIPSDIGTVMSQQHTATAGAMRHR